MGTFANEEVEEAIEEDVDEEPEDEEVKGGEYPA